MAYPRLQALSFVAESSRKILSFIKESEEMGNQKYFFIDLVLGQSSWGPPKSSEGRRGTMPRTCVGSVILNMTTRNSYFSVNEDDKHFDDAFEVLHSVADAVPSAHEKTGSGRNKPLKRRARAV